MTHPERYEDFRVGDDVFCLAWVGMPFRVTGKDDEQRQIFLDGQGPCSLKEGCVIDINPNSMFMLTHNLWDQIWYWPDRAGETYTQVVERFLDRHHENEIVTGYLGGHQAPSEAGASMAFRLSFGALSARNEIHAQPVAALSKSGEAFVTEYDPSISSQRWHPTGPAAPLKVQMTMYRWSLAYGDVVLNWEDFRTQQ